MDDEAPVESKVVSAVGVSVNTGSQGREMAQRIEKAMAEEILKCNEEGISTSEENSVIIRDRMMAVRDRVKAEIQAERTAASASVE